jgi:hypothetical protein
MLEADKFFTKVDANEFKRMFLIWTVIYFILAYIVYFSGLPIDSILKSIDINMIFTGFYQWVEVSNYKNVTAFLYVYGLVSVVIFIFFLNKKTGQVNVNYPILFLVILGGLCILSGELYLFGSFFGEMIADGNPVGNTKITIYQTSLAGTLIVFYFVLIGFITLLSHLVLGITQLLGLRSHKVIWEKR